MKHDAGGSPRGRPSKYAKLAKEELSKTIEDKDRVIAEMRTMIQRLEEDKANFNK